MTWALVMGGAITVYHEIGEALRQFGKPDVFVAVKDIWMEYPTVDVVCTYHIDRIPKELAKRRSLGYPDPKAIWTYHGIRPPRLPIEVKFHKSRGGSSGLLGAHVALLHADRAVLAGIPMDMGMRHYHERKKGQPWKEGRLYKPHWLEVKHLLIDKVKSMSGWTQELLGSPTREWVHGLPPGSSSAATPPNNPAGSVGGEPTGVAKAGNGQTHAKP